MAFTSFVSNHAFSQGKIHLGALRIYPAFGERIEVDDNVYQISGKGTKPDGQRETKQSDIINIYSPALKLDLPIRGGGLIPGKQHDLSLDWRSDFKNYRDHADQNQQNQYFTASGTLRFNRGFEINLEDDYKDTESPAGSETDNIHPVKTNLGHITIDMPDYFRKFDAEISYSNYQLEYDERALRRANRFEHRFTLKIPYKLTPKISLFPEYSYGFIEYDSQSIADAQSDSHYNEIYAGVEWDITAKSTGILKLGFTEQRYDDTETSDIKTVIAEIGVRVYLTKRMELDVNAGRGILQSEFTASSNSYERSFGDFKISRKVWKDLSASFNANYEKQVYHGSERKDDVYGFGLSTEYRINKRMSAAIRYSYRDRNSNFVLQSDRINKVSVGIILAF
jgi:predicted porin